MTDLAALIQAARGEIQSDLVLKGGWVVNVFSGELEKTDLAVKNGMIVGLGQYTGHEIWDVPGKYVAPGLIETHLHIESSMLCPVELARVLLTHGTTTIVADPHEIANVLGIQGVRYMLKASEKLPLDFFFMAPSCVPATHLETSGASLTAEDLRVLLDEPRILGLAEMMNFPGVINCLPQVLEKIKLFASRPKDGHAPLLSGADLNAYLAAGIESDHECTSVSEAREKLARGMRIFIREGSTAQDLLQLLPLVNESNSRRISFCTDDLHAEDLLEKGHLDYVLKKAVKHSLPSVKALTMATLNAAEAFGLKDRGALAPGYRADIVIFDSLESLDVESVFKDGRLVAHQGGCTAVLPPVSMPDGAISMNVAPLDQDSLKIRASGPRVRVIELVENQIITGHFVTETPVSDGCLAADPDRDLARLVVVERHQGTGNIGHGLVKGFGLKRGALASSVAHDSHNIIAVGMSAAEILTALRTVTRMRGGLAVIIGDHVRAEFALPIAGLISPDPASEVAAALKKLKRAVLETGCEMKDPFMMLSFLALPVIPKLKLTDKGLVDVERFDFVDLFVS
ncbi:MAG: adenine deaminase [Deltaproteobacteria bacterium]|nr:adenine deaminase [Deltaproteobacteria bacterium]